jgi:hypothetical protein
MRNGSETVIRTIARAYPEEFISLSHCFLDIVKREMVWRSCKAVKDDRLWSVSHIGNRYTKPVFTGSPLQLYGYQTVNADLYLHAFPGGYTGMELLKFLRGIIESREPQECLWSTASKFGFCWNFAHGENELHQSFTLDLAASCTRRRGRQKFRRGRRKWIQLLVDWPQNVHPLVPDTRPATKVNLHIALVNLVYSILDA